MLLIGLGSRQERTQAFQLVQLRLDELRRAFDVEPFESTSTPTEQESRRSTSNGLHVVVIGTSEGGLGDISKLLSALPRGFTAAVLVALRGPAQNLSLLQKIVNGYSSLPVGYAVEGDRPRPGFVHVVPPGAQLVVRPDGALGLRNDPGDIEHKVIDQLFMSAAAAYGPRVIGVILSGCDGDGVEGMKAIEEADGVGIVQDPNGALEKSLPMSVIEHDRPHYIGRIDGIATLLQTTVASRSGRSQPPDRSS